MKLKILKKKVSSQRRGSLGLIAAFLISSAILRVAVGANEAYAKVLSAEETDPAISLPTATCEPPKDIAQVLAALDQREKRLKANEDALENRMQALAVSDTIVERKLTELVAAEAKLLDAIALAEVAAETDITNLTAVYENMKPADAAALFEEMDPEFAAGFLGRMRPESAAGVMAGLEPTTAYTISVVLAGRNANVPTE